MFEEYLNWSFAGNTGTDYATALGIFIGTTVFFWLFKKIILVSLQKLAKKTSFQYDDMLVEFLQEIRTPVYLLISLYVSTRFIEISDFLNKAIEYAAVLGLTYYVVKGINRVITHFKEVLIAKREKTESKTDHSLLEAMESVAKATVWIIALLLVLSNLGFDITALIAGLGIGGLAIAIAAQTILADAFAAVSIYFDKPFKVGDFIKVK
ncbi:mechanosensitive ion channel, partial [Candidatus Micrarchaeota archaeon]|nr:mechanosensitive ion channel [Candidatus Micrarchaeota archaeon]